MRVVIEIPEPVRGLDLGKIAAAAERAIDEIVDGPPGLFTDVITDWPSYEFKPSKKRRPTKEERN